MEEKTNKAKLKIFKFLRKLAESQIAFDKISRNCAFYGNSINIHLLEYFCMQNSYLRWKTVQNPMVFHENAKIIENHSFLLIV